MVSYANQEYMPELYTQRLLLRKLTMNDAQDIYAYSKDPSVARYVLWHPHRSVMDSRFFLKCLMRQYRNREPASYGITLRDTGRVIGTIGFSQISQEHRCAEIGYSLARDCWNKGYMTEALGAMLEYGFRTLMLHRIEATHDLRNPASGKVMEKCGMRCEGVLRGTLYSKGEFIDVRLYAILSQDCTRTER